MYPTNKLSGRRPHATTILGVKRGGAVALAGDGQVTLGDVVLKHGARKVRVLGEGRVLAGFAGAVADALTLFGKFEAQLKTWDGNLRRAAVELAKEWRTDRYLRRLEAQLIVADVASLLVISGDGDVIEPDDGIVAIGSGAPYATAAAKALIGHTELSALQIVESAMAITAEICIFTNERITIVSVGGAEGAGGAGGAGEAEDEELPIPSLLPPAPADEEDEEEDEEDEERPPIGVSDDDEDDGFGRMEAV